VDIIYELFNLNTDEIDRKLYEDLLTVKDANFNRVIEEISGETGRALVEKTDVVEKVAKYLGLAYQEAAPEEGEGGGEFGGFGGFGGEEAAPSFGQPSGETGAPGGGAAPSVDMDAIADEVAANLPEEADDEDITKVVDAVAEKV
jgi:hypothetical protein